jgi:hypothetical protein
MTRILKRLLRDDHVKTDMPCEHHVMMKAKLGVMQLQAKECLRLPANYQKLGGGDADAPYGVQRVSAPLTP